MEAIVEYNYSAQEPDELTIRKGDVIKEIKVMLGGWWEGTLRDKRGMFPDNFVKVIEPSSGVGEAGAGSKNDDVVLHNGGSGRRWCKVLYSYDPCNEDELTLVPQDSVEFLEEVEEGWWRGRHRGRVGVFPSNFVSPPISEEQDKNKEREFYRVLFPYEASNEDELSLVEGDVIMLISRDAPDKGWWKGELRGKVGLFPDNFVEVWSRGEQHQDQDQRQESNQNTAKSTGKHALTGKRTEKAQGRKSLDLRNNQTEGTRKSISTSSSTSLSSSSATVTVGGGSGDKKSISNQLLISSLKKFVGDNSNNNANGIIGTRLGEEFDGVERGEGAPLSHLTVSRAKAPRRRRLPSAQHLRHHTTSSTVTSTTTTAGGTTTATTMESSMSNGSAEATLESLREDDGEGPLGKARRKVPWVEELKMSQMERRKTVPVERLDKVEVKKERNFSSRMMATSITESSFKTETDSEEGRPKERERSLRTEPAGVDRLTPSPSTPVSTAYVPYHVYSQLVERVITLEDKQTILQRTISQLSDQLATLLANNSTNTKQ